MDHLQEARDVLSNAETSSPKDVSVKTVAIVAIAHALIAISEQLSVVARSVRCPECGGMLISGKCPQQMCSWKPCAETTGDGGGMSHEEAVASGEAAKRELKYRHLAGEVLNIVAHLPLDSDNKDVWREEIEKLTAAYRRYAKLET